MDANLIGAIIFWSVWLAFFTFGIIWCLRLIKLKRKGISTEGEIIKIIEEKDSESGKTYTPIIKFDDQKGKTYEIKGDYVPYTTKIGDKTKLYYFPDKPEKATNNIGWQIFVAAFMIFIGCAAFVLVAYEMYKYLGKIN